jgi:hypothetical protein
MFAAAMMASMVVGAATTGLNNSFGNVEASCVAKNKAKEHFNEMKTKMEKITFEEEKLQDKITDFNTNLKQLAQLNAAGTAAIKATYKEKKMYMIVGFSVTIFLMILLLLLKYFDIPQRLWNLIMGNK